MNITITHDDSLRIKPLWVCKWRKNNGFKDPLIPPHRLWGGHLSFGNSPGCRFQRVECLECGLLVSRPVGQWQGLYLQVSGEQGFLIPGPPLTFAVFSFGEALKELWLGPLGQPVWDHPGPNISVVTWLGVGGGVIFGFVTSYWVNFAT